MIIIELVGGAQDGRRTEVEQMRAVFYTEDIGAALVDITDMTALMADMAAIEAAHIPPLAYVLTGDVTGDGTPTYRLTRGT